MPIPKANILGRTPKRKVKEMFALYDLRAYLFNSLRKSYTIIGIHVATEGLSVVVFFSSTCKRCFRISILCYLLNFGDIRKYGFHYANDNL